MATYRGIEVYAEGKVEQELDRFSTNNPVNAEIAYSGIDVDVIAGGFDIENVSINQGSRTATIARIQGEQLDFQGGVEIDQIGKSTLRDIRLVDPACCELQIETLVLNDVRLKEVTQNIAKGATILDLIHLIDGPVVAHTTHAVTNNFTVQIEHIEAFGEVADLGLNFLTLQVHGAELAPKERWNQLVSFLPENVWGNVRLAITADPNADKHFFQLEADLIDQGSLEFISTASAVPGLSKKVSVPMIGPTVVKYRDAGLVQGWVQSYARQSKQSRNEIAAMLSTRLRSLFRAKGPRAERAFAAIELYLRDPESLQISISPKELVPLPMVPLMAAFRPRSALGTSTTRSCCLNNRL